MADGDALQTYELPTRGSTALNFKAQFDRFLDPPHEGIERFCLRLATAKLGNGSDKVAVGILFDNHVEFALHTAPLGEV